MVAGSLENEAPRFHQRVDGPLAENPRAVSSYSTRVPFGDVRRPFSLRVSEVPGAEYPLSHLNGDSADEAGTGLPVVSITATRGLLVGDGMKMRYVSSAPSLRTAVCAAENFGQTPPSISNANDVGPGVRYRV